MSYKISGVRKLALSVKNSEFVREVKTYPGAVPFFFASRSGRPLLLDMDSRIGMGAILSYAVRLQAWADNVGQAVRITSTSPLYSSGDDIFVRYFDRPDAAETELPLSRLAKEWIYRKQMPQHIDLNRTTEIFERLFRPNAEFQALLLEIEGGKPFDLAIHMRGTDKVLDSGLVEFEAMFQKADGYLQEAKRVFLATDNQDFRAAIKNQWPNVEFVSYDLGEVENGMPRHFSSLSPELKAKEALANIYMISRAPVCVRTSSFMSSFSRIINPTQKTVTINRTILKKTPFPEKQILESEEQ